MTPEGFEPPTFGSGIRRATIAPWSHAGQHSAGISPLCEGRGYVTRLAGRGVEPQWRNWTAHQTSNLGVAGSSPAWGIIFGPPFKPSRAGGDAVLHVWQHVRAVKESDLKSDGLCPRRFKSCCCRFATFCVPCGGLPARRGSPRRVHSSAVEHEIADLAVAGSIPAVPYFA